MTDEGKTPEQEAKHAMDEIFARHRAELIEALAPFRAAVTPEPERSEVGGGERERIAAWLARGNPPGGMNLPSHDGTTPSIRSDLRALLAENARLQSPTPDRAKLHEIGYGATLPDGYQWGHDAMEQFRFGASRATDAILTALDSQAVRNTRKDGSGEAENQRLAEGVGWRPIDEAPRDGFGPNILVFGRFERIGGAPPGTYLEQSYWIGTPENGHWSGHKFNPPTHWMPLPEPPTP